ncbi:MAG: phosphotransacetylase family protein [Desulfovermiculus sp.]
MPGLYIGSTSGFAGKNLLAMALGSKFQKQGYRIGYMKPVGTLPREMDHQMGDEDAFFVQDVLGLSQDLELVTPALITEEMRNEAFTQGCPDLLSKIVSAYSILSREVDIMLVCGSGSFLHAGKYCNVAGLDVAQSLGTKVILIDRFIKEFYYDYIISARELLGPDMIGAMFNCVPENKMNEVDSLISPLFQRRDIHLLGTIPEDRLLNAIRVGDLAQRLGGKIITMPGKQDLIVEDFLIGTMQVENFMVHFKKRQNSAVLVGGDRSDLQLVALEGKCPCLILTGNLYPNDIILTRSEVLGIPIMVVREDTFTVAQKMENIMESSKLRDPKKITHGVQLVNSILDYDRIMSALGLEY